MSRDREDERVIAQYEQIGEQVGERVRKGLKMFRYLSQEDINVLEHRPLPGIHGDLVPVAITGFFRTREGIQVMNRINVAAKAPLVNSDTQLMATLVSVYYPLDCSMHSDTITVNQYLTGSAFIGSQGGVYTPPKRSVQLELETGPSRLVGAHLSHKIQGFLLYNTIRHDNLYFDSFGNVRQGGEATNRPKPVFLTDLNYREDPRTYENNFRGNLKRIPNMHSPFSSEPTFVECDRIGTESIANERGEITQLGSVAKCTPFEGCSTDGIRAARLGRLMDSIETWPEINFRGTGRIEGWVLDTNFKVQMPDFVESLNETTIRRIIRQALRERWSAVMKYSLEHILRRDRISPTIGPADPEKVAELTRYILELTTPPAAAAPAPAPAAAAQSRETAPRGRPTKRRVEEPPQRGKPSKRGRGAP